MHYRTLFIITALMMLWIPHPAVADSSPSDSIQWLTYTNAKNHNQNSRKYFIYFHIDNCPACHMIEKKTFTDKAIIDYINSNYTPVKVNGNKEMQVASRFGVWAYPHLRFLTAEGNDIAGWPGYVESKRLLSLLEFISTDSYKNTSYKEFVKQKKNK